MSTIKGLSQYGKRIKKLPKPFFDILKIKKADVAQWRLSAIKIAFDGKIDLNTYPFRN